MSTDDDLYTLHWLWWLAAGLACLLIWGLALYGALRLLEDAGLIGRLGA